MKRWGTKSRTIFSLQQPVCDFKNRIAHPQYPCPTFKTTTTRLEAQVQSEAIRLGDVEAQTVEQVPLSSNDTKALSAMLSLSSTFPVVLQWHRKLCGRTPQEPRARVVEAVSDCTEPAPLCPQETLLGVTVLTWFAQPVRSFTKVTTVLLLLAQPCAKAP